MRGLTNAFEPLLALRESASYLRELRTTFRGNLGLAAAAYNAGPGAVEAWLARRSVLPAETQAYVMIVTGYAAEAWAAKSPPQLEASAAPPSTPERGARCAEIAKSMIERTRQSADLTANPAWGPWGLQLAGNWTEAGVLAAYERLRRKYVAVLGDRLPLVLNGRRRAGVPFLVRVSEEARPAANALCAKLKAAAETASFSVTRATRPSLNRLTAGIATPSSSAGRTAGASRCRYSPRRTCGRAAAAPWRACGVRLRRRSAPC